MIHKTKKTAKKLIEYLIDKDQVMIYTDESEINNKIGAAAVSPNIDSTFSVYLEPSD